MTSAHNQGQGHGQYDETAAKPSIGQKIGGGIEELVGKATNNPGKVAEGEAKKHGYAGPPGGAKGYNETLHKGENPGGLAGEHSINPSSHHGTTGNSHTGSHTGAGVGGSHTGNIHTGSHTGTHSGTGIGGTHNDRHEGLGHSSSNTHSHTGERIGNTEPFPAGQGQPGFGGHPQQQSHHVGTGTGGGLGESRFEGQHSGLGGGSAARTHEGTGVGLGGGPAGHDSGLPLGSGAGGGHHGQHGGLTGNGQHGGLTGSGEHGGLTGTGQHGSGVGGNNVQPPFGGSERRY